MTLDGAEVPNPENTPDLIRCSKFYGCRDIAPKHLNCTWDELISEKALGRAYPVDGATREEAKSTLPALGPAAYPFGTTRNDRNIESIQLFVLDFDNCTEQPTGVTRDNGEPEFRKSPIPGAPTLEEVCDHLRTLGFTHFGYHSFSSTPENERFRIIIPLDRPSDGRNWKVISEWLLSQLDMGEWRAMGCLDLGALHRPACLYYAAGYWTQEPGTKDHIRFISHIGTSLALPTEEDLDDMIVPPQPMHPLRREWAERQAAARAASSNGDKKWYQAFTVDFRTLNMVDLLTAMGSTVQSPMSHDGGFKARCTCPFSSEHTNGLDRGDAVVFFGGQGWPRFKCMHDVHEGLGLEEICVGAGPELVQCHAEPFVPKGGEKAYPVSREDEGSDIHEAEIMGPDEGEEDPAVRKRRQVWINKLDSQGVPVELIRFDKSGAIAKSRANLKVILSHGRDYRDAVRLNQLLGIAEVRVPNYSYLKPDDLDNALTALQVQMEHEWGSSWAMDAVSSVVNLVATGNPYHPVVSWLGGLPEWDGIDRVPLICEEVLGVNQTPDYEQYRPLYLAFMRGTLIGAIRRLFTPGCKLDTVTILFGDQAARKSTFWKTLCADPDWFNDSKIQIDSAEGLKILHHAWIHEFSEIDDMTSAKSAEVIKAFLSSSSDKFRHSYARHPKNHPRRCILVGSTNKEQVLNDPTGSRRFWVIPTAHKINIELLQEHLEQIWAQAYAYFEEGIQHYLTDEMEALRARQSGRHQMENRFSDLMPQILQLYGYDLRPNGITLNEIFTFLEGRAGEMADGKNGERKGYAKPTNSERRELAACLRSHGWTVKQGFINGVSAKCFMAPMRPIEPMKPVVLPPPTAVHAVMRPLDLSQPFPPQEEAGDGGDHLTIRPGELL